MSGMGCGLRLSSLEDMNMIVATDLVLDRLRKRVLELHPELSAECLSPAMEKFVQDQGEEHDAEEAYRYYLSEKYGADYSGALDQSEFAAGCRSYAMADVQDSWLISFDGCYFRLDGVTEE